MLEFPRWKYWLVAVVLLVAAVVALPNVFGEDAALQMVRKDRAAVGADAGREVIRLLADRGVALVPQGREIFPLLTVKENLETGFAPVGRDQKKIPDEVFELFPVLGSMLKRRGGDLSGGQQQQLAMRISYRNHRSLAAPRQLRLNGSAHALRVCAVNRRALVQLILLMFNTVLMGCTSVLPSCAQQPPSSAGINASVSPACSSAVLSTTLSFST